MSLLEGIKGAAEYLEGFRDAPPAWLPLRRDSWPWGVWWAVLITLIIVFCGQSS